MSLTVNELFSGIGAQRSALDRLGISYEIAGISEIDKNAINSYEAVYGKTRNYGDISQIDKLDYADLWTYSFPCTDISVAGRLQGMVAGKTRSGLLYEIHRLLCVAKRNGTLPCYLLPENVKNLVGKKFRSQFDDWLDELTAFGYTHKWAVLNARNYSVPQNRERVFVVSCLNDEPPDLPDLTLPMRPLSLFLEDNVDEKYFLKDETVKRLLQHSQKNVNPADYFRAFGSNFCSREPLCCASRGRNVVNLSDRTVGAYVEQQLEINFNGWTNTLTSVQKDNYILVDGRVRALTPRECWRLMGFTDAQFDKAAEVNGSQALYKQAGNSIVVNVLAEIFRCMFALT